MKTREKAFLPDNNPQGMTCEETRIPAVSSLSERSPASRGELLSCGTKSCIGIECRVAAFGLGPRESLSLILDMNFRQGTCLYILDGVLITLDLFCEKLGNPPSFIATSHLGLKR